MAADCTVIAAGDPESAAEEVIGDAGFCVGPTAGSIGEALAAALRGDRPPTAPVERAQRYDLDKIADRAEATYQRIIASNWHAPKTNQNGYSG